MNDFDYLNVGKPTISVKQQEQMQPTDVAFCGKREMGRRYHLLLLRQKTRRRVVGVLEGIRQGKAKDSGHGWLGHFDPRTGNKCDNTHKTATLKVKKGVVHAAVKEDS